MRFKTGQEVLCPTNPDWVYAGAFTGMWFWKKKKKAIGPKKDEIVTVRCYTDPYHIMLEEYASTGNFEEKWFVPLISTSELMENLKQEENIQV